MRSLVIVGAACATLFLGSPATAQQIIDAGDTQELLQIARGYGSAELDRDSSGDPMIVGRMQGVRYGVFFYGCDTGGEGCTSLQFASIFEAGRVNLRDLNSWNEEHRFGKAYLNNSGSVIVEMNVNLDGGVTRRNMDDTFDFWRMVAGGVRDLVESRNVKPR